MPISSLLPPAFGAILLAVVLLVPMAVRRRLNATGREVHRRGTVVIDSRARHRLSVRRTLKMHDGYVSLGGIRLTPVEECKHFKLIGTTGTGKSTAIRELLIGALRRGDRAIISDPDGGYLAQLYRRYRGDVVLNPFERESMRWDPFAEISNAYDIEQLASALIPFSDDPGTREWRGYARTFFTAVFKRCGRRRNCSLNELWRLLAIASNDELRPLLGDTPAQPFLEPDNARMFGSIRSVLSSAIAPLEYIRAQRAAPFSVRKRLGPTGIKVAAPAVATRVIDRAIEVYGAAGVSDDTPLAYFYAWARVLRIVDGPDAVHRRAIARQELRRERPYTG